MTLSDGREIVEVSEHNVTNEDCWHNRIYNSDDKNAELLRYVELDNFLMIPVFYYQTIKDARTGDIVKETKIKDENVPCGYDYIYEVVKRGEQPIASQ